MMMQQLYIFFIQITVHQVRVSHYLPLIQHNTCTFFFIRLDFLFCVYLEKGKSYSCLSKYASFFLLNLLLGNDGIVLNPLCAQIYALSFFVLFLKKGAV
jgi:hypothetical protein